MGKRRKGRKKRKKERKEGFPFECTSEAFSGAAARRMAGGICGVKGCEEGGALNLDRPLCRINFAAEGVCRRCQRALRRRSGPSDAF